MNEKHIFPATGTLYDDYAIFNFAKIMSKKMAKKRKEGKYGWWNSDLCSIVTLQQLLKEHVEKEDWLDVAIFAMMIYMRRSGGNDRIPL